MGLGDGLLALVLSNNLYLNGGEVVTFHPFLDALQGWFPHLPIHRFPPPEHLDVTLQQFDRFFIIYEKSPWMQSILQRCRALYRNQTTILNPIATPRRDYPYWEEGRFDGNRTFVENLYAFCRDILRCPVVTRSNGIVRPEEVTPRRLPKRIVIHPCSSREGKNWPRKKFAELVEQLARLHYMPVWILTQQERQEWDMRGLEAPQFSCLGDMAFYVAESGAMIGNDSGIGHLASCLGLSTLTICRSAQAAKFWRPSWTPGEVVTPSPWIPNVKGLRLRDKYWKTWVSIAKVLERFNTM
jgi:heptosyltransferase III